MKKLTKNLIQKVLQKKLQSFGLNPNNWNIVPTFTKGQYLIVNKNNQRFCLRGISILKSKNNPCWKDIELISL